LDIIDNAKPSVNMKPCRITRGHFILLAILLMDVEYCLGGWGDVFSCYFNQIKLSHLPDAECHWSIYSVILFTTQGHLLTLLPTLKKKDSLSCVCACMRDKRAEGVHITLSCRTEKLPMPCKNGGNSKKSENSHSAFIATNRGFNNTPEKQCRGNLLLLSQPVQLSQL